MLKGFISYSHTDRLVAAQVKAALTSLRVDAFMAHDDIHVSQQWQVRILTELRQMDVFVPLLSQAFLGSHWTAQEVGFAIARPEVLIIPASIDGSIPKGFLGSIQSQRLPDPVGAPFFRDSLAERYPRVVIGALIDDLAGARSFRGAEALFRPLLPYLERLTPDEAIRLAEVSTANGEIWDSGGCRTEYLPLFLQQNRQHIPPEVLAPLEFQIEHGRRYYPPEV